MLSLIIYREFGDENYPSITEFFSENKYDGQDEILAYLKNGKVGAVSMGNVYDIVTNEKIAHEKLLMSDGRYSWNSIICYYVEKYNLRLPKEFEQYVLDKIYR